MFRVIALPANEGDSLLVTWGAHPAELHHMLIDGGSTGSGKRVADAIKRLGITHLDVLVVTHIDSDHIKGVIEAVGIDGFPKFGDVWFNGLEQLIDPAPPTVASNLSDTESDIFSQFLVDNGHLTWNKAFDGKPIYLPSDVTALPTVTVHGMKVTLLGPPWSERERLLKEWPKAKREIEAAFSPAGEVDSGLSGAMLERRVCPEPTERFRVKNLANFAHIPDDAPPNGSSIAFMLSYDDRHAIFTGDAYEQHMLSGLNLLGSDLPNPLDLYKMGHHGSARNNCQKLMDRVNSRRYLFTSNGAKHALPDRASVARIIISKVHHPELLFNYKSKCTMVWSIKRRPQHYGYRATFPTGEDGRLDIFLSDKGM